MSKPKQIDTTQDDLFCSRLSAQLNPQHPLMVLAHFIDWEGLELYFKDLYRSKTGHPPLPIRVVVGLIMLQHLKGLSDEEVVRKWVENPYFQYFCGYDHFQWDVPIHPSSLTRWRKRIGKEGLEKVLAETIQVGKRCGKITAQSCEDVIADTTVMEKAIAFPTDSTLLKKARESLVALAKKTKLQLRQTYHRVGQKAYVRAKRYGHAGQYKRMAREVKKLKSQLGRVVRDIERKVSKELASAFQDLLEKSRRLLTQQKDSSGKLYSLHAQEVECIAKGKATKKYEFGCKVSLVVTHKQGFVLSSQALHGNPYDGHTLKGALFHATALSGVEVKRVFVDKGYKKHGIEDKAVYTSGQKKLSPSLQRALKRRSAIEPHISHMKHDGKLGRNYLKGKTGDLMNALGAAIGHNLRLILNYMRLFFILISAWIRWRNQTITNTLNTSLT